MEKRKKQFDLDEYAELTEEFVKDVRSGDLIAALGSLLSVKAVCDAAGWEMDNESYLKEVSIYIDELSRRIDGDVGVKAHECQQNGEKGN